jgi:hypothetical protein
MKNTYLIPAALTLASMFAFNGSNAANVDLEIESALVINVSQEGSANSESSTNGNSESESSTKSNSEIRSKSNNSVKSDSSVKVQASAESDEAASGQTQVRNNARTQQKALIESSTETLGSVESSAKVVLNNASRIAITGSAAAKSSINKGTDSGERMGSKTKRETQAMSDTSVISDTSLAAEIIGQSTLSNSMDAAITESINSSIESTVESSVAASVTSSLDSALNL